MNRFGVIVLAMAAVLAWLLAQVVESPPRRVYRDTMWIAERHYARATPPPGTLPENYIERRAHGREGWTPDRREWAPREPSR